MSEKNPHSTEHLPDDEHLREDISAPGEGEGGPADQHFTPGLTNAGQQVAGLASASGYGEGEDPGEQDANHPV